MTKREQVLDFAIKRGAFRARDIMPLGISPSYLDNLTESGVLEKVGRGLFRSPDHEISENDSLVEVALYLPNAVICLTSALQFHRIGTQLPAAIWIALPNFTHPPKLPIHVEVVRMNSAGLTEGLETHLLEGVNVRIFNPAKTIADCFKYRDVIGMDIALEALEDGLRKRIVSPSDIYKYAAVDRVTRVISPYLEAFSV